MMECLEPKTITIDEDMDDDVISIKSQENNIICNRCKKELMEENDTAEQIRIAVQEAHTEDSEEVTEKIQNLVKKKWPECAYQKTTLKVGNPLLVSGDDDLLLVLKTPEDTSYITNKFKEKYPGISNILENDDTKDQVQYLENITKTKKGIQSCTRVYLTTGDTAENHLRALRDLELTLVGNERKNIAVVAPDEKVRTQFRKLVEIVMLQAVQCVDIYVPKKESSNVPRDNKFDTIRVSSANKSYAEMLKAVRENINPDELGLQVKSTRKLKDNSLLIVTEKEHMEKLKEEILNKSQIADIEIVQRKTTLIISGMDEVTTKEEILEAVNKKIGRDETGKLSIQSLYSNRSGEQVATIETPKNLAAEILETPNIKIGWSSCRVKEKVSIVRCTNCLRMGHTGRACKSKKTQAARCLKCTQEGHTVKDCNNESYCLTCARSGHRSDSMSCPKYRKLIHQKEAEMST
uniref:CCHC-type domain-containing protein n=1 Tax=Cacopsylla melanoneura TaxID=428564 RepID=A0A8D8SPT8_9HEMI